MNNMMKLKRRFITSVYFQDLFAIPLAKYFIKNKVSPNLITILGIIMYIFTSYFYINKKYYIGVILFIFALILDSTDGKVARGLDRTSNLGTILDSIADKFRSIVVIISLVYSIYGLKKESIILVLFYLFLPVIRVPIKNKLQLKSDPTEIFWYSTIFKKWLKKKNLCGLYNGWERSILALAISPLFKNKEVIIIISSSLEIIIYVLGLIRRDTTEIDPY